MKAVLDYITCGINIYIYIYIQQIARILPNCSPNCYMPVSSEVRFHSGIARHYCEMAQHTVLPDRSQRNAVALQSYAGVLKACSFPKH